MGKLERRLSLSSVVALSISAMLGSGIFVLPGLAAAKTGSSLWLAYLAAGLCVLPAALSKAELATAMPTSGGTYVYVDRTFGPWVGTISGLGLWLSLLLKASFALVGFSAYLYVITDVPIKTTALVLVVPITWLNVRGVRGVSRVQIGVVAISLVGLAALSFGGTMAFDASRLDNMFSQGATGFLSAIGFVFVSFAGVTKIVAIAEEVKNPTRNLPAGILLSLGIVTFLYGGVSLILVGTIDLSVLAGDSSPIYTLAIVLTSWKPVAILTAVLGVLTMTSMANAGLLAASRFPFAMSRDDLLPASLRKLHSRYLTPVGGILVSAVFMMAAIVLFDIERIAKLASAVMIMMFMMVNLAVIVLRETRALWYRPPFRSPLYPWMQGFGLVSGAVLLVVMGPVALLAGIVVIVAGTLLYLAYGFRRADRLGAIGKRGQRRQMLGSEVTSVRAARAVRTETDSGLSESAAVVVALFGSERSPTMLVELGHALSEGGDIEVVHLTELPEQVGLDAVSKEAPLVSSLRRRIVAMAEVQQLPLRFAAISSRDIIQTVHDISRRLDCRWLVMEWQGRSRSAYTIANPLGWLTDHLSCNLATFYDHGVGYIRKILVHVEPGPHDALVLGTADTLARANDAEVSFVEFVNTAATNEERQSAADYLDQVRDVSGVDSEALLIPSDAIYDVLSKQSVNYDLLITPAKPRPGLVQRLLGTGQDKLTDRAMCSVLRLQAPPGSSHAAFERYRSAATNEHTFFDFVHPKCTEARLAHKKKDALFNHFAEVFSAHLDGVDSEAITRALWERERTQNTALGRGIALPHATIAEAGKTYLGIFTAAEPMNYDAPDGGKVDVFFVTLGTPADRNEHLVLLGSIAKLVKETALLSRLRDAQSSQQIVCAIRECSDEGGL